MNISIFNRTNKGIIVSKEGEANGRQEFCISMQHYSFIINAFGN
ncbi:hypothetical protein lbkm_1822 [Lachnospiraceae bacterium KM106-2]|nr:hypothetical protein lbkm_1822 [Lachnospiraceae bacterium KM106-2]